MSFLDRLFKRSEPVQQKSANPPLFSSLSLSAMPKMTERQYLEAYKGWVFSCTNAIARRMAAVELKLQQHNADGDWIDIPHHKALDLIHRVNDFMSFYDLWFATQAYIELDGNAFWKLNYNGSKQIEEIWILDPTQMEILKDPVNFIKGYSYTPPNSSEKIPLKVNEVIHFKNFHPRNPWRGMGTVEAAGFPIDIGQFADEWQRNFFGNGTVLSGVLSAKGNLTDEQYMRIKENWNSNYKGTANSNKMALLEGDMTFTPLTPSAREMQFTESKKNIRDEILGIFNVPKPILGILEDINLASAQVAEYNFSKDVIKPKMTKNITTLNEFYLPLINIDTTKYRFWFKDPVPEDIDQKLAIIASGRGTTGIRPWMTANEARAVFGYEPLEGGDVLEEPTLDANVPNSDQSDDDAHAEQNEEEEDNQENEEKALDSFIKDLSEPTKKVKKKSSPKANDYLQEQIVDFKKTYLDLNKKLESIVLDGITQKSIPALGYSRSKEIQNDMVNILFDSEAVKGWVKLLFNATKEGIQKIFERGGAEGIAETNVDVSFSLDNPRALDYLNDHALETTDSYTGTWKESIALAVQEGVEQGSSIDDIKDNVKQLFLDQSDYRAERIARSETITAYNAGNLEGYKESGVVTGKSWLPDDEACPICQENADAGVIGLDEDFPSGDPQPIAHPNCECSLQPSTISQDDEE